MVILAEACGRELSVRHFSQSLARTLGDRLAEEGGSWQKRSNWRPISLTTYIRIDGKAEVVSGSSTAKKTLILLSSVVDSRNVTRQTDDL